MTFRYLSGLFIIAATLTLTARPVVAQDDKVHRALTTDQMEKLLNSMKLEFKKIDTKKDNTYLYDFRRSNYSMRLHFFSGKDIMLDALFNPLPLEKINEWNTKARFSRATIQRDAKGPYSAVESNLDFLGGVTEGTIKHFFDTFDKEVQAFDKFVRAASPSKDDTIVTKVPDQMIEKVLKGLGREYKKMGGPGGAAAYEFEVNNHKLKLTSFGGADLMLDAHFKPLPLDKINKYNQSRKFVRIVYYNVNNMEFTAIECNLDCVGGVTESIVSNFITASIAEVEEFTKYVKKADD